MSQLRAQPAASRPVDTKGARVSISDVSKVYAARGREIVALSDVDLDIAAGEFVTILGPSGCGKSTLLHIVGGFEGPTRGQVAVDGGLVTKPGRDRGMVFQSATLFPWKTISGNVAWPLQTAGRSSREVKARVAELLGLVGLSDFASAYPAELSGGMRQRAAIARALAMQPRVLLMDEPFGALDALTRELMQEELVKIADAAQLTVLFVTHDISEAVFLGDRVVVMSRRPGRIATVDRIDQGLDKGSPEFAGYHARYWEMLRQEQRSAAAGD